MKKLTVNNIHEYLRNQGVDFLTSESCGIGIRGLFDLSERGKILVEKFLLVETRSAPWNNRVGNDKAVASVKLPHTAVRSLAIFTLFMNGAEVVIDVKAYNDFFHSDYLTALWDESSVFQLDEYVELLDTYKKLYDGKFRVWTNSATGANGNNTHVFSGRTE